MPDLRIEFRTNPEGFKPYLRDKATLARPWAIPGTPGLEHRTGGIEKEDVTGNVSYDSINHEKMVHLRAEKVARIADDISPVHLKDVISFPKVQGRPFSRQEIVHKIHQILEHNAHVN